MFPNIGAKPNQNDQHLRRVCGGGEVRRSSLMPPKKGAGLYCTCLCLIAVNPLCRSLIIDICAFAIVPVGKVVSKAIAV